MACFYVPCGFRQSARIESTAFSDEIRDPDPFYVGTKACASAIIRNVCPARRPVRPCGYKELREPFGKAPPELREMRLITAAKYRRNVPRAVQLRRSSEHIEFTVQRTRLNLPARLFIMSPQQPVGT